MSEHEQNGNISAGGQSGGQLDQPGAQVGESCGQPGDAGWKQGRVSALAGRLPRFSFKNPFSGPLSRCVFIGIVTLFLLIPLGLVRDVVYERSYLYSEATDDIRSGWGRDQTVSGPALIIPYTTWEERKEMKPVGKKVELPNGRFEQEMVEEVIREYYQHYRVVLPSTLSFESALKHEIRYRGIYRQALYTAPIDVQGSFTLPQQKDFSGNIHKVHWEKAYVAMGVADLKTIAEAAPLEWNGKKLEAYKPGTNAGTLLGPGFHAELPLSAADAGSVRDFSTKLTIRGSGGISFTPVGENSTISLSGTWPDPKFQSQLLPVDRQVGPEGFSATWLVSNLTRTYPQSADIAAYSAEIYGDNSGSRSAITRFTAGVDLYESVSLYRMVKRAVDYGILFIAVSFVALFAFEMITRRRMHLLQYGMVGLSMSVFYLVLLSLAEHVSFGGSFVAASLVTVLMNSLYVAAALSSRAKGLIMAGVLAALYAVLFSILRMEDIALLTGTCLVLVMMGVLMYVTRKLPTT